MLAEKYVDYVEMMKQHQNALQSELLKLWMESDLTVDEREYMNVLMDDLKRLNESIVLAVRTMKRLMS